MVFRQFTDGIARQGEMIYLHRKLLHSKQFQASRVSSIDHVHVIVW